MRTILIIATVVSIGLSASCQASTAGSGDGRVSVVTSFYPLEFAAESIGGPCVAVSDLTPPGVEPHDLELAPDDVAAVASADVVFYLGGGFQPALEEAVSEAEGRAVDLLQAVSTMPVPAGADGSALAVDPHVWLDPTRYRAIADRIGGVLADAARSCGGFAARRDRLDRRLERLDADFRAGLTDCRSDTIVTNHAAFGYLAQAYGLHQEAIAGLEPESEPSAERLAELKDLVERGGVTTIFTEELVSPKVAETLATEAGVRTRVLFTLEGLTEEESAAGKDYLSLMQENLDALHGALGCP
jgi:zinc transport system substrate-binding protein